MLSDTKEYYLYARLDIITAAYLNMQIFCYMKLWHSEVHATRSSDISNYLPLNTALYPIRLQSSILFLLLIFVALLYADYSNFKWFKNGIIVAPKSIFLEIFPNWFFSCSRLKQIYFWCSQSATGLLKYMWFTTLDNANMTVRKARRPALFQLSCQGYTAS